MTKEDKDILYKILNDNCDIIGSNHLPPCDREYVSKIDKSYVTFVGIEEELSHLVKYSITEQIQSVPGGRCACLGFSPRNNKWYGWSHRAIYGFTIGSEVKIGHCGFMASNVMEFCKANLLFWGDDKHTLKAIIDENEKVIKLINPDDPHSLGHEIHFPAEWGRGEWTAKTMEDAKQMAIDFARGVS